MVLITSLDWLVVLILEAGYLPPSPTQEPFGLEPKGHSILDGRELIPMGTCKPSYPHAPGKTPGGGQWR